MIASVIFSSVCSGIPVRVMTRPGSQLLGINGRDDGPLVSLFLLCPAGRIWMLVGRTFGTTSLFHLVVVVFFFVGGGSNKRFHYLLGMFFWVSCTF